MVVYVEFVLFFPLYFAIVRFSHQTMKSLPVLSHSVHSYCTLFDVVCCLYLIRLSFRLGSDRRGFELFDEIVGIALCEGAIIRT